MNLDFADKVVASVINKYTDTAVQSRDQMFSVARAAYQFAEVVFEVREDFKKKHNIEETNEGFASYLVRYIDAFTEEHGCCGCSCDDKEDKEEAEKEVEEKVEEKVEEVVVEKKKRGRKPLLAVTKRTSVIADADVFTELNNDNDNTDNVSVDTSVVKRTRKPRLQADEEKKTRSKKKEEKSDVFVSVKDLPATPFITDVDDTQPVTVIAEAPRRRGRPRKVV